MERDRIKKLATADGFEELFFDECNPDETYLSVYERLETERVDEFGARKYSCYSSFRTTRSKKRSIFT